MTTLSYSVTRNFQNLLQWTRKIISRIPLLWKVKMGAYDTPIKIFDFAYWPNFSEDIGVLSSMVEHEEWKPKKITEVPSGEKENYYYKFSEDKPVLASYILNTYKRIIQEGNKLLVTSDEKFSCFHTGLFSSSRLPIYVIFEKNSFIGRQYWKFLKFSLKSDRQLLAMGKLPEMCDYSLIPSDFVFNPTKEIVPSINHILYDHPWRYSCEFQKLSKMARENLMDGALRRAEYLIRQTSTMVVPQYYMGTIQLLMPLCLMEDEPEIALILEAVGDSYRANTVLPLDWAYMNARVITKPNANWLQQLI